MSLQDYLNRTMSDEVALKGRIRQLYEQKDALRGFGEIDGGAANSWTRFIHRFTKKKKHTTTMAELKEEYQKYKKDLAKKRVAAKKKVAVKKVAVKKVPAKKVAVKKVAAKKVKYDNPWLEFLAEYRDKNKGFTDQRALVAAASVDYKELKKKALTGKGLNFDGYNDAEIDDYIDNYPGYDEEVDDPRDNDAYLSDLCAQLRGEDHEGGFGTKAGAKKNKWIAFLKLKSNKGKPRAQLSELYKKKMAKKKAPAKKKVAIKKKAPAKKKVAVKKDVLAQIKNIDVYLKNLTKKATTKKKVGKRKTVGGVLLDY